MTDTLLSFLPPVLAFVLGLAFGSFGNVLIYRVPRRRSLLRPPSSCPRCRNRIAWYDNIPVLSWLMLRGHCRHCGNPISARYPLVELATGVLFVLLWVRYPFLQDVHATFGFFLLLPLFIVVLPLMVIDCRRLLLPDRIVYPLALFGLVGNLAAFAFPEQRIFPLWSGFLAALVAFLLFHLLAWIVQRIMNKEGMGGGDIKLIGALGFYVGLPGILLTIFLASVIGILLALFLQVTGRMQRGQYIPFGPAILLGALLTVFWGDAWIRGYLQWTTGLVY